MDSWPRLLTDSAIVLLLVASIWRFRTPRHARTGNLAGAFAMLCAVGIVLHRSPVSEPVIVTAALLIGAVLAWATAMRLNMIHIPAMVAFQNGAGGAAACIVSVVVLTRSADQTATTGILFGLLGIVTGAATFSGSMIATGKLANLLKQTPVIFPKHDALLVGLIVGIGTLGTVAGSAAGAVFVSVVLGLAALSVLLGIVFSIRIGGADMPVSISFLNATTGLAAAFCGIAVGNRLLAACGALVAASGSILTHAMCRAMNRSLLKVFAGIKSSVSAEPAARAVEEEVEPRPSNASLEFEKTEQLPPLDLAIKVMNEAGQVVIIPGYGMALAQAQFEVAQLADKLEGMGKEVRFAVHPVAGRMPGHMNVLLAEAEVDYDKLFEMDDINPDFEQTDLALVVGACDVVNPAAIEVEGTPISGMPILRAHEAKHVVVCNLDEKPGYSGVENPLYAAPGTIRLFGDAKTTVSQLLQELV